MTTPTHSHKAWTGKGGHVTPAHTPTRPQQALHTPPSALNATPSSTATPPEQSQQ